MAILPRPEPIALLLAVTLALASGPSAGQATAPDVGESSLLAEIQNLMGAGVDERAAALVWLDENWQEDYVPALVDALRVSFWGRHPSSRTTRFALISLLEEKTGQRLGADLSAWFDWIWDRDVAPHPEYAKIKSFLYGFIDPKFAAYFSNDRAATIRLSEVRWGGVLQDGIPPLRSPKMLSADEADYLADTDVVFGIEVNGDVRAYPKRILAWHEMFTDRVGDVEVTGVY